MNYLLLGRIAVIAFVATVALSFSLVSAFAQTQTPPPQALPPTPQSALSELNQLLQLAADLQTYYEQVKNQLTKQEAADIEGQIASLITQVNNSRQELAGLGGTASTGGGGPSTGSPQAGSGQAGAGQGTVAQPWQVGGGGGNLPNSPAPAAQSSSCVTLAPGVLQRGDRGPEVSKLISMLVAGGYGDLTASDIGTAVFGPRTEEAVKDLQREYRNEVLRRPGGEAMSPTGVVGPATRAKLNQLFGCAAGTAAAGAASANAGITIWVVSDENLNLRAATVVLEKDGVAYPSVLKEGAAALYEFSGIAAGTYTLRLSAPGYTTRTDAVRVTAGNDGNVPGYPDMLRYMLFTAPPVSTSPPPVSGEPSVTAAITYLSDKDYAGTQGQFRGGVGPSGDKNDWLWGIGVHWPDGGIGAIKSITVTHDGTSEAWSTSNALIRGNTPYPIVVIEGNAVTGAQLNYNYNQTIAVGPGAGAQTLLLYGQPALKDFKGGVVEVVFDNGKTVRTTLASYSPSGDTSRGFSITVVNSPQVPAQNIVGRTQGQVFGGFDAIVTGDAITISALDFNITPDVLNNSATPWWTNISIYDENGRVVAGPVDVSYIPGRYPIRFTDSFTIPSGRHTFVIKGKTEFGAAEGVSANFALQLSGMTSSVRKNLTVYPVTLSTISVRSGAATNQPSITILSPNGGETIELSKDFQIQWRYSGADAGNKWAFHFLKFPNGSYCYLGANGASLGSAPYGIVSNYRCPNIPANVTPGMGYRIATVIATAGVDSDQVASDIIAGKAQGDESDRTFTIAAPGGASGDAPDLVIEGMYQNEKAVSVGQKTRIVFTIANRGTGSRTVSSAYSYLDQSGGFSYLVPFSEGNTCAGEPSLAPGTSCLSVSDFIFSTPGVKTLKVKVDPLNKIAESREDNNEASLAITVGSAGTGTSTSTPSITVLSPNEGGQYRKAGPSNSSDTLSYRVSIKNPGVGKYWVYLTIRNDATWRSGYFEKVSGAEGDFSFMNPYEFSGTTEFSTDTATGEYYLLAEWTDQNGSVIARDFSDRPFTITGATAGNRLPQFVSISGPTSLAVGQVGTWQVSGLDFDGTSLTYGAYWGDGTTPSVGTGNATSLGGTTSAQFTHSYSAPGTYTLKFGLEDPNGGTRAETRPVTVTGPGSNSQPSITVLLPNGGETIAPSASSPTLLVRWSNSTGLTAENSRVTINFCTVGDQTTQCPASGATNVAGGLPNTGEYRATVWSAGSATPPGRYVVNVIATRSDGTTVTDYSDAPFTITSTAGQPTSPTITSGSAATGRDDQRLSPPYRPLGATPSTGGGEGGGGGTATKHSSVVEPTSVSVTIPVGVPYRLGLVGNPAFGFSGSFNWALSSGSLPPGINLTKIGAFTGQLGGTPTQAGVYRASIRASDALNTALSVEVPVTITVTASTGTSSSGTTHSTGAVYPQGTAQPSTGITRPSTGITYPTGSVTYPSTSTNYPATGTGAIKPPTGATYPTTSGTPGAGVMYPTSGTTYPSIGSTYPSTGMTYPSTGTTYPSTGTIYPSTSGVTYPSGGATYPSTGGVTYPSAGTTYPSTGTTRPSTGITYPPAGTTYPSTGTTYPSTGTTYPSTGGPTYPSGGTTYPSTGTTYPSTGPTAAYVCGGLIYGTCPAGQACALNSSTVRYECKNGVTYPSSGVTYPTGGTTYPSTETTYPSTGTTYPSTGATYPSSGTPYSSIGVSYPSSGGVSYPSTGSVTYPSTGTTYPSISTKYPSPGTTYPSAGGVTYPSSGGVTYPAGGVTYPSTTGYSASGVPVALKSNGLRFSATVISGNPITLTWESTGANYCSSNWTSSSLPTSGIYTSAPLYANMVFTLKCFDSYGTMTGSDSISVIVEGSAYPSTSGTTYPSTSGITYPSSGGVTYPSTGTTYPSSGVAYPSSGATYPSTGTTYPSTGVTYPSSGVTYPSGGTTYPSTNGYPSTYDYRSSQLGNMLHALQTLIQSIGELAR